MSMRHRANGTPAGEACHVTACKQRADEENANVDHGRARETEDDPEAYIWRLGVG